MPDARLETNTPSSPSTAMTHRLARLARNRRFWEVAGVAFLVLLATNLVVLIPRYEARERGFLEGLEAESWAVMQAVDRLASARLAPADFATIAQQIIPGTRIEGGAIHDARGATLQLFGKPPNLALPLSGGGSAPGIAGARLDGNSYDIAWRVIDDGAPYYLMVRTDASSLADVRSKAARDLVGEAVATSLAATVLLLLVIGRAFRF